MKSLPSILRRSALALALLGAFAHAEDIDLYAGVTGTTSAPNVLFFIDNSSNWSNDSQAWNKLDARAKCATSANPTKCLDYADKIFGPGECKKTQDCSLTQGQVELRALKLVLNELVCGPNGKLKVNAGLMLFNDQGTEESNSEISGYIRHRIALLDKDKPLEHCKTLLDDLTNIDTKITTTEFKGPSSASYGLALYEAFKYFGGWTNPAWAAAATPGNPTGATGFGPVRYSKPINSEDSGAFVDGAKATYKSPLTGDNLCGNNYIVLIGNTFPNEEPGTSGPKDRPTTPTLSGLDYRPPQIYPVPLRQSDKVRFADEWAAFLYQTDVSPEPDIQNVRMFTVDVHNAKPNAEQSTLLKSMADQSGPGGYFTVGGDLYRLISAFEDILTQIASVNSVFAAASLPVSVNTQGSFLNQVFMGVFRPDGNSQQRWAGNLKQYRFALSGDVLALTDKAGQIAVDSQNTGFLQHCATSFWTTDSSTYWQTVSGFNAPSNCVTSNFSPYSDAPDGPIVERGAAAQRLRQLDPDTERNIRTCSSSACSGDLTDFRTSTSAGLSAAVKDDGGTDLVNWVRGANLGDGSTNATGFTSWQQFGLAADAPRPTLHGDVVHSRPLAVNYGTNGSDDVVVFYGSGDGMLRAVDGNQEDAAATLADEGKELWAFVAPEHWSKLKRLRTNSPLVKYAHMDQSNVTPTPEPRSWFFDGSIGGYLERNASTIDKVWIYPTMRRGGNAVYAFNVSSRPSKSNQPELLWRYSDADRMGQSWSTPVAIRVKGIAEPLVVFGAGYDACEDSETPATCDGVTKGKGIVVLDAEQGKARNYRFIGAGSGELDSSAGRFVADITSVDVNGDGYIDVLYAPDTRGNVWRINTSDPNNSFGAYTGGVADWPVNKVAAVGNFSGDKSEWRKFLYAPSTVTLASQNSGIAQVVVLIGSGDREKPSATSNAAKVENRFYGIFDDVSKVTTATITVANGVGASDNMMDVTGSDPIEPTALAGKKGWYLNLSSSVEPYEQVVTTPLTIAGETFFNTFQAKSASANACLDLGTARGYRINFQTGTRLPGYPLQSSFISPGFPPSPVGGTVLIDDDNNPDTDDVRVPFVIGGQGKTPILPQKLVPKVEPTREPVYRFKQIDE